MSDFWSKRRVLVTGASGFLGIRLVARLKRRGVMVYAPPRADMDMLDAEQVARVLQATAPTVIFHCAARVGGIGMNQRQPADLFSDNLRMGLNLIDQLPIGCKLINICTVCAYPKFTPAPFREDDLWNGYPESTNAPYGIAKKAVMAYGQARVQQNGAQIISLLLTNLYGIGQDDNPNTSHVIPALIRKLIDAKRAHALSVTVWGSGEATRDFLYVEDAADALLLAAEHYDDPAPINIGTGIESSIADLATQIAGLVGYTGELIFDASQPDGQPRRVLDTSKARDKMGWQATTPLDCGLVQAVAAYHERVSA